MSKYIIYTDGSHLKHTTGRLGIGGILVDESTGKVVDKFSEELGVDFLVNNYGTSDVSNPTCEMLATLMALRKFKDYLKSIDSIVMKADYQGCQMWTTGKWKCKAPYIKAINTEILDEIKNQNLNVSFEWVKGHQTGPVLSRDAVFNGMVDKLAKGEDI